MNQSRELEPRNRRSETESTKPPSNQIIITSHVLFKTPVRREKMLRALSFKCLIRRFFIVSPTFYKARRPFKGPVNKSEQTHLNVTKEHPYLNYFLTDLRPLQSRSKVVLPIKEICPCKIETLFKLDGTKTHFWLDV